jgi:hypothetical protein
MLVLLVYSDARARLRRNAEENSPTLRLLCTRAERELGRVLDVPVTSVGHYVDGQGA